ncbi:hypothetical protein PR202_gb20655 [Eleusine coracana subsp. coracana]|uniref:DUF4005 domain-containing protein n=1 Tax=Eleusine coracana subsp. coracana TaxID=191504 RepID=A0AAV5FBA1_ELECO|nr:hypothetical protein QOZ80_1BG0061560 [Eleusine coracana subsp. coracana]GJN32172.1 hypothetical protein PR202_gb20655 [Eleusine coracana subsp. coracana]
MGKAARWFRSLLGGGKKQQQGKDSPHRRATAPPAQDRKRWSFARSRDSVDSSAGGGGASGDGNAAIARAAEAAWLRSVYGGESGQREQSKHAIAVAAATAAAADAAVAAAQAAVEVVRLTSQGPGFAPGGGGLDPRGRNGAAAVKIQTAFRGYLAKKALRALKALVKLQALVRGYLVRRQAAATLQSMQALVRAQAAVRAARSGRAVPTLPPLHHHHHQLPPVRPRFSLQERYADDTRSEHGVPSYSRRLSASIETASYTGGYDRSPKIVEMDTGCRPTPRSRASSSSLRTTTTSPVPDGDEWWSVSSPVLLAPPPRIAVTSSRDNDYWCVPEKPRPATAQCTPRLPLSSFAPATPTKGCGAAAEHNKGYMSSTQSSEAKTTNRSQSAPRQRPDTPVSAAGGGRKRVPLSEVVLMEARASLSGVNVQQRSCSNGQNTAAFDFRKAVVSRFERPAEERGRDMFLQTRW